MNFDRARAKMAEQGFDAIIPTSYENVAYLSGTAIMTQRSIPERLAAVVLPCEGEPSMVVCTIEEPQARRESHIKDLVGYVEFVTSPAQTIAETVRKKGLENGTLGLEMRVLSAHYYQELQSYLPKATLKAADRLLDELRMVKSTQEIALLERAALCTDAAIRSAYELGGVGVSDKVIADQMANHIQGNGADSVAFLVLGAGPSASLAHPVPLNRPLEVGDIVRCDVGGYYGGYYSDLARTAVVGEASEELQETYHKLWQAHETTIAAIAPGIRANELYGVCLDAFKKNGLNLTMPHIGHSLGLGLHEHPMIAPFNDTTLEAGMVLAIEPIHRFNGGSILHVEDLIEVTADGHRILSRAADWSEIFVMA